MLALAPYVDARFGFELRVPRGWYRVESPHGVFAANGPTWDHEASIEVFVWPARTIAEFLARFERSFLSGKWFLHDARVVVDGRPALKIVVANASRDFEESFVIVEVGGGSVLMMHGMWPIDQSVGWQPWFLATLGSLEIWDAELTPP